MMDLVFDIETDDLKATKVHCIVAQNPDTNELFKFPPERLQEGYEFLATADRLIGHNIIWSSFLIRSPLNNFPLQREHWGYLMARVFPKMCDPFVNNKSK